MTPSTSADLELMRASALLDTDPADAARRASAILVVAPDHAEAKLLLAAACRRLGDPLAALNAIEEVAGQHPRSPVMQLELGRAYAAAGRGEQAIGAFRRSVELDPELAEGWRELAAQLFAGGNVPDGDAAYSNYERRAVDPPGLNDALAALADERLDVAADVLRRRLAETPGDVVVLRLLADVARRRNDLAEAERCLDACLEVAPGYSMARYDLACVYFAQHRVEKVLPLLDRLLALDPGHSACLLLRGKTLRLVGRTAEAIELLQRLVADSPDDPEAWVLLGHVRREVGEQSGAIAAYRRAIELRPHLSEAYFSLANLKTVRLTAEDIAAIRLLLARTSLLREDRIRLEFSLGKALEDEGEYADSFGHYARGNALRRASVGHDADATTAAVRRSKSVFTDEFFAEHRGWGSERVDPIFIIGLPRSGSTLLEQMLASHSQIEGTRELSDLSIVVTELAARAGPDARATYPQFLTTLGRSEIESAAAEYLARTQVHRSLGRPRFIDKMPPNFIHVGLIHLMFPRAAIIDARRHPMGCAFSCYKQLFSWGAGFSYDFVELVRHFRDYVELMDHFDAVLPGRVHRIYYEQLIANPEAELRSLLEYCQLPYEADCLRFYENRRIVQSVSSEQVRQPIYGEGVDQWRHYAPWLEPLRTALGDLIERYPGAQPPASDPS